MSFLSVLKKFGLAANAAASVLPAYAALAQSVAVLAIPGSKDDQAIAKVTTAAADGLVRFQNVILDAEVFGQALNLPGADKATASAPAVLQLFLDLPVIKGKKPKDPAQSKADAAALGGALAKFLNGFEG